MSDKTINWKESFEDQSGGWAKPRTNPKSLLGVLENAREERGVKSEAKWILAQAKAFVIACAYKTSGRSRDEAQSAIWKLWSQPKYDATNSGILLTVGMVDDVLNSAFD